jgi:plasmid stabilization system protein ParE
MQMNEPKLELLAPAWVGHEMIADIHLNWVRAVSAQKITDKILDTPELLKTNPNMGIVCSEQLLKNDCYRKIVCGKYLCFYRVIGNTVYVYHIVDGRTAYPKYFE